MKMTRTGMIIISWDSLTKYQTITTRMNGSYYLSFVPNDFINSQQFYSSILKISGTDAKICIPSFQNQQGNSVMVLASTQEKQLIIKVHNTLIQAVASLWGYKAQIAGNHKRRIDLIKFNSWTLWHSGTQAYSQWMRTGTQFMYINT